MEENGHSLRGVQKAILPPPNFCHSSTVTKRDLVLACRERSRARWMTSLSASMAELADALVLEASGLQP